MEEEIQVLSAQVNAYSCEVDKQKGLVTQSQEKHKTEVVDGTYIAELLFIVQVVGLKSQINELQSSQQQVILLCIMFDWIILCYRSVS